MDSKVKERTEVMFEAEIERAKYLVRKREEGLEIPDFDIRGRLYKMALNIGRHARGGDITAMKKWWGGGRRGGPMEVSADIAAGTGFLTIPLHEHTGSMVYAVDWSHEQLDQLNKNIGRSRCLRQHFELCHGSFAQETKDGRTGILDQIKEPLDIITSFGGLHHVFYQEKMMEHAEKLLRGGGHARFAAADVGANTALAMHFDEFVSKKCLTGHTGYWLSQERLEQLIKPYPSLRLDACEMKHLTWSFDSEWRMGMFFKGLHAYDLSVEEIVKDLKAALGCEWRNDDMLHLNWPMLFFRIIKV